MTFPARIRMALPALLLTAACSHSDPIGSWSPPFDGPLTPANPARLTYSSGTDVWPSFSQDGSRLLYAYERLTPDNDRCLGLLPAIGGQRSTEVCAMETGQALKRDGFEHGALSQSGRLAFTRHSGNIGGPTVTEAALYVAQADDLAGARKVFDLIGQIAGAPEIWDYLLNPVWISDTELAFMATDVQYIPPGPFEDPDTIYTGLKIAKVRLDGNAPTITVLANVQGATAMAYDPTLSRFAFLRNDSVFTVPGAGGAATFYFTPPEVEGRNNLPVVGLAAGGGKIWVTWTFVDVVPINIGRTHSIVAEVTADGQVTELAFRDRISLGGNPPVIQKDEGRWGRIAASPDGKRLAFEGTLGPTGDDIYLLELP